MCVGWGQVVDDPGPDMWELDPTEAEAEVLAPPEDVEEGTWDTTVEKALSGKSSMATLQALVFPHPLMPPYNAREYPGAAKP